MKEGYSMKRVRALKKGSKRVLIRHAGQREVETGEFELWNGERVCADVTLSGYLLPHVVAGVLASLVEEAEELMERNSDLARWGKTLCSVYLGGQKIGIERPRIRNLGSRKEEQLASYKRLQEKKVFDEHVYRDGLRRISQRDYEGGVEGLACAYGISKSSVSRSWVRATAAALAELQNRSIAELGIVAVLLDGKHFSSHGSLIALGVSGAGYRHVLGIYETSSENKEACEGLLNDLEKRGLPQDGILFVVDGGTGINAALDAKYQTNNKEKRRALRVRCYRHKKENIKSVLPKNSQKVDDALIVFENLRTAKTQQDAHDIMLSLESELKSLNLSAHKSFQEAKDDLMALHELGLISPLKRFFSTTNPIESLNSILEEDLRRNKRWRNTNHFHRALAAASLNAEKRMNVRKIRGHKGLAGLRQRILALCGGVEIAVDEFDQRTKAA
jgi:putative transposase